MFRLLNLLWQTPEDLKDASPKSLLPGIYYCKDTKGDWCFRRWTGVIWSQGVESFIEAKNSPEEYNHPKPDGVRIIGWYILDMTNATDPNIRTEN